jgi:hypothetical protein
MFEGLLAYRLDPSYKKHNELVRKMYSDFAKRQGLTINFVEANTCQILNDGRIAHDFHKILRGANLWESLQLPMVLLGLSAPLSIGKFNRLINASDSSPPTDSRARERRYKHPYASEPRINEKFAWADLRVTLDGYVDRFSKTSLIKEYLEKNEYHLRVCNDPPLDRLNCSACEKCFRTIVPLVLEGVDPNNCGFRVNRSTFESMRYNLEKKKLESKRDRRWKLMQGLIPGELETNMCGSREFLMWLRNLNIDSILKKRNLDEDIFNLLPYYLAVLFDALYYSVHDRSVSRSVNALLTSFLRRKVKNFA